MLGRSRVGGVGTKLAEAADCLGAAVEERGLFSVQPAGLATLLGISYVRLTPTPDMDAGGRCRYQVGENAYHRRIESSKHCAWLDMT